MPPLTELKLINHYGNRVNIKNNQTIEYINVVKWNHVVIKQRYEDFNENVIPMYSQKKQDKLNTFIFNNFKALQHPHIQVQVRDLDTGKIKTHYHSITSKNAAIESSPNLFETEALKILPFCIDEKQNLYFNQYKALYNVKAGDENNVVWSKIPLLNLIQLEKDIKGDPNHPYRGFIPTNIDKIFEIVRDNEYTIINKTPSLYLNEHVLWYELCKVIQNGKLDPADPIVETLINNPNIYESISYIKKLNEGYDE